MNDSTRQEILDFCHLSSLDGYQLNNEKLNSEKLESIDSV